MRGLYKLLGASIVLFFIVVFTTATVSFIRKVWFANLAKGAPIRVLEISGLLTQSRSFLKELDKIIEKDDAAKAIVVRVNSPGGLVAPSQELYEGIRRADQKIPVVISMGPLAASGGYYLALGGRKILANPGTLTASIGVIIEFVNTQKLYEWAKVERFTITGGKFKSIGSPFRPMTPEERKLMTAMVEDIHAQFKATVKERRGLSDAEMETATDGRVMTGTQALKAKLVDQIGDLHAAIELAKTTAGLPKDAKVDYVEPRQGLLMKALFGDDSESGESLFGKIDRWTESAGLLPGWRVLLLSPIR